MRLRIDSRLLLPLLCAALLSGCGIKRSTETDRSEIEQLMISTSIDRAVDNADFSGMNGHTVKINTDFVKSVDQEYLIAALRKRILESGAVLGGEPVSVTLEPSASAVSSDDSKFLIGLPSLKVPLPLSGELTIPEIPIFRKLHSDGTTKIRAHAIDADGRLHNDPISSTGHAKINQYTVLLLINWKTTDVPELLAK